MCARDGQVRVAELSATQCCKTTKRVAQHKGASHKVRGLLCSPCPLPREGSPWCSSRVSGCNFTRRARARWATHAPKRRPGSRFLHPARGCLLLPLGQPCGGGTLALSLLRGHRDTIPNCGTFPQNSLKRWGRSARHPEALCLPSSGLVKRPPSSAFLSPSLPWNRIPPALSSRREKTP